MEIIRMEEKIVGNSGILSLFFYFSKGGIDRKEGQKTKK